MFLTIAVLTMNRSDQVKEAIESCFACNLPNDTEFVIFDNASTDNTKEVVEEVFSNTKHIYHYYKSETNLGVGGGRNALFKNSNGKYFYVLDDDAVISPDNVDFFIEATNILENNSQIIGLSTQIYDEAWEKNRRSGYRKLKDNLYLDFMFCGGSHFLRRNFFSETPYLNNKYGYEELPATLAIYNSKKMNVFCENLLVIHRPKVNKWKYDDEKNHEIIIKVIAIPYAIKKTMFPIIFKPILYLVYRLRCWKHLAHINKYREKSDLVVRELCDNYYIGERIKVSTVWWLIKNFGITSL